MKNLIIKISVLLFIISACRKEEMIDKNPNLRLQFSTDSILFDTVFTNKGTTTRVLKVFNYNKNSVVLSSIRLAGGDLSAFKININGIAATSFNELKIRGNDSAYVFIKAFIDPSNASSPFIVEDELQFSLNGNIQKIPLNAYGRNAIYLNSHIINSNTTFTKDMPYIVYNYLLVNNQKNLTLNPGARLYFHKDAQLFVSGSLQANGTLKDSITLASDRLERIYADEAGQWKGVHFLSSSINNKLNYVTLKNALIGIRVDSLSNNSNPKLLISNSMIKNHTIAGLLGYTATITGINNLFSNCGQYLFLGLYGGNYNFYQNTFANYNYNFPRKTPSVFFSNHLNDNSTIAKNLSVEFTNNIIFGSLSNELDFNKIGSGIYEIDFQNNLIKTTNQTLGNSNIYNQDPLFINPRQDVYIPVSNSLVIKKGKDLSTNSYYSDFLSRDILQKNRTFPSTLGCYEN
jgi:hypothetical protein